MKGEGGEGSNEGGRRDGSDGRGWDGSNVWRSSSFMGGSSSAVSTHPSLVGTCRSSVGDHHHPQEGVATVLGHCRARAGGRCCCLHTCH